MAPRAPQRPPRRPQEAPRGLQDAPKKPPRGPKKPPRCPQEPSKKPVRGIPRDPQIHPRGSWPTARAWGRVGPKATRLLPRSSQALTPSGGRRNGVSHLNPPAHRAEGRVEFRCESSLQGFSPPPLPPPEASAIPPPGCVQAPFRAPRRLQDGFQDELDFQIVLGTLSGRISAPFWPPRGPLLAPKIDSRGARERLFGPTTRTNWKLQKTS